MSADAETNHFTYIIRFTMFLPVTLKSSLSTRSISSDIVTNYKEANQHEVRGDRQYKKDNV